MSSIVIRAAAGGGGPAGGIVAFFFYFAGTMGEKRAIGETKESDRSSINQSVFLPIFPPSKALKNKGKAMPRRRGGRAPAPCSLFLLFCLLCAASSLTSALKPEDWKVRGWFGGGGEKKRVTKNLFFQTPSIDRAPFAILYSKLGLSSLNFLIALSTNGKERVFHDPSKEPMLGEASLMPTKHEPEKKERNCPSRLNFHPRPIKTLTLENRNAPTPPFAPSSGPCLAQGTTSMSRRSR